MMPTNLTPDQKDHIRIAQRSHLRITETWDLFNMYLSEGQEPVAALRKAQEAVAVWAEWMDANEIDFPEIEQPTFAQELGNTMQQVFSKFPKLQVAPTAHPNATDPSTQDPPTAKERI